MRLARASPVAGLEARGPTTYKKWVVGFGVGVKLEKAQQAALYKDLAVLGALNIPPIFGQN